MANLQFHSVSPRQGGIPDSGPLGRCNPILFLQTAFPTHTPSNCQSTSIKYLSKRALQNASPSHLFRTLPADKLFDSLISPVRLRCERRIYSCSVPCSHSVSDKVTASVILSQIPALVPGSVAPDLLELPSRVEVRAQGRCQKQKALSGGVVDCHTGRAVNEPQRMRVLLVGNRVGWKGPKCIPGGRGAWVQKSGGSQRDSILSLSLSGL